MLEVGEGLKVSPKAASLWRLGSPSRQSGVTSSLLCLDPCFPTCVFHKAARATAHIGDS